MAKLNLEQLQKNLNEVNYPLSKKDLVMYAEQKGVDEQLLRLLKKLPTKQYQTPTDVSQSVDAIFTIKVNPVQLEKNLHQVNYPLNKKDLVMYAELKGVDEQILRALKRIPAKEYKTLADISQAIEDIN